MSAAVELYVYYKAAPALAARIQEAVRAWPDVRLLLREDGAELQTWMEIHTGPQAEISAARLAAAMAGWLDGPRHMERFRPAP